MDRQIVSVLTNNLAQGVPGGDLGSMVSPMDEFCADGASVDSRDWPTGRLLSTAARLVEHAWNERLAAHGLTHAGVIALHVLGDGPLPQTQLAGRCRVEDQTMSRTLERLERDGYVTRDRDTQDRRRVIVTRTAAGSSALAAASQGEADLVGELEDEAVFRAQLVQIIRGHDRSRRGG